MHSSKVRTTLSSNSFQFHPDPNDYTGVSTSVVISAGSVTVTVPVTTNEDNFVEPDEYFSATLSLPGAQEAVAVGSPDVAFVTITDTICMFEIGIPGLVHSLLGIPHMMLLNCTVHAIINWTVFSFHISLQP